MILTINIPDNFATEAIAVNATRFRQTRKLALRNASMPETELTASDKEIVEMGIVSELLGHVRRHRGQKAIESFDDQLNALPPESV